MILKRQLARDSDALDRERNAAALEREKSETERNKLKEVMNVSCASALLSFREEGLLISGGRSVYSCIYAYRHI